MAKREKEEKTKHKKKTKLLDEMPGEKKYNGISPINRFNIIFADLQILFTVFTIICLVWYLFNDKVFDVLQFVFSITLFIIGYNNKIIYNKPKMSYVYYGCGLIILVTEIISLVAR